MNLVANFRVLPFFWLPLFFVHCNGQEKKKAVTSGAAMDNIKIEYYGIPAQVAAQDTSPAWTQNGQKILVTGVIYQPDGKTPAPGILLYYYHTNTEGKYLHKEIEPRTLPPNSKGQTHGYIRGWVKTGADGRYSIYTVKPGAYPSRPEPAHIHVTIKEPGLENSYYIDDMVFDSDELLTSAKRKKMENRGGSGVLRMVQQGNLQIGERNIILGLNIPGHRQTTTVGTGGISSGRNIGEDMISFTPFHAWGPDKGSRACPVCKYGWYHGILYFVGNNPDWKKIKQWLVFLESESKKRDQFLKVYFIYGNENGYSKTEREKELEQLGRELQIEKTALTFVPSFSDETSDIHLARVNQRAVNTFILYKRSNIIDKFVNLEPSPENFSLLSQRLNQTINDYFRMPGAENK